MLRPTIVILTLLNASVAFSQKVFVVEDSSRLVFPNNVVIDFSRKSRRDISTFEFSPTAIKTLMVQCNYVFGMLDVKLERVRLLEREMVIKDSVIHTLKAQLQAANDRILNYSSGYENMKSATVDYDKQVTRLIADLEASRKNARRASRRMFVNGAIGGLAVGIVVTAILLSK